ncbi:unnamed protein product [Brugia timori]|uniref:PLD phosphodiesterase domain-containing protein n=1 Tax=Brugia timori TaxID=42155 RepID=A0A0R3QKK8_9BILA|nr:unnamed protein product [Brugia timori]
MTFRNESFIPLISCQAFDCFAVTCSFFFFGFSCEELKKQAIHGNFLNETECSQKCRYAEKIFIYRVMSLYEKRQDVREYFCINKNGCDCFRIKLVQSTPDNLTFTTVTRLHSTYSAWNSLIKNSEKELILVAYKTSLRGEHVLNDDYCQWHSNQGSKIYDALVEAGLKRKIRIRMIENYPPKDKGDNEDGINLAKAGSKASPRSLNDLDRNWDLFSILNAVEKAKKFLYVEVMDYFPMFIYNLRRRYWPVVDNAIRRAILRGVEVKILTAAIHFSEYSLRFLSSLETLNRINDSSIEVRILKVPTDVNMQNIMKREQRMHTKFLVTDTVAVIGTSNWSGDYFDGGTMGAAFVLNQTKVSLEKRHFIRNLIYIFLSHWSSNYTHDVLDYERECLQTTTEITVRQKKILHF